ncbi:MAG TPA: S49 family peptidase [Thermoguttaceae bacterium]|nr:S49 family peptidase [Thermoguttaceae bacterium]
MKTKSEFVDRLNHGVWPMEPGALRSLASQHLGDGTVCVAVEEHWNPLAPVLADPSLSVDSAKLALPRSDGAVAVLSLRGVVEQHRSWWAGLSTDEISEVLARLMTDPSIGAVVLDWDSPGGVVYGVPELADQIRGYRGVKPVYSIANAEMYSAAYWIGSAASKTFVSPSGGVGSVGVWTAHVNATEAFKQIGWEVTVISSTPEKVEAGSFAPLSDEALAAMQADVDTYYQQFLEAVGANRGKRTTAVAANFGKGRTVMPDDALAAGMVDGIATLGELLGALVPRKKGSARATAKAKVALAGEGVYQE